MAYDPDTAYIQRLVAQEKQREKNQLVHAKQQEDFDVIQETAAGLDDFSNNTSTLWSNFLSLASSGSSLLNTIQAALPWLAIVLAIIKLFTTAFTIIKEVYFSDSHNAIKAKNIFSNVVGACLLIALAVLAMACLAPLAVMIAISAGYGLAASLVDLGESMFKARGYFLSKREKEQDEELAFKLGELKKLGELNKKLGKNPTLSASEKAEQLRLLEKQKEIKRERLAEVGDQSHKATTNLAIFVGAILVFTPLSAIGLKIMLGVGSYAVVDFFISTLGKKPEYNPIRRAGNFILKTWLVPDTEIESSEKPVHTLKEAATDTPKKEIQSDKKTHNSANTLTISTTLAHGSSQLTQSNLAEQLEHPQSPSTTTMAPPPETLSKNTEEKRPDPKQTDYQPDTSHATMRKA